MAGGAIALVATVTDADGDHASASLNLGSFLTFHDDGPSISLAGTQLPSLVVDETDLSTDATADFSGAFSSAFGADGAGSVSYALSASGDPSGLVDVATGLGIVLGMNGSVVEGWVGGDSSIVAFTVSVDGSGNVTLDQLRALQHPDGSNPDDPVSVAGSAIALIATITDADGDQSSASLNLGNFLTFHDDGPSISLAETQLPSLVVDETDLSTDATADFSGAFSSAFGADGAGSVSYALSASGDPSGLVDVATGLGIVLGMNGSVVEGWVGGDSSIVAFTVSVDGSGNVTLDQLRALQHPDGSNPDDPVSVAGSAIALIATITDADGDQSSASLNLGNFLTFHDDGPTAFYPGGIHVVLGVEDPAPTTVTKSLNFLANAGADGVGSIAFTITDGQAFMDQDGKQLYLDNEELFLFYDGDSQHIEARTLDGDVAFTAEIDINGDMSITMFTATFISNTQVTSVTDLSGIGGGNVPFKGLNIGSNQVPDPDGSDDVLVSSEIMPLGDGDAGTVNSTANVLGVGTGEEISDGDVIRYDLVTGLSIDDKKNSESYSFDGYQQTFAFRQKLVVSGSSKDADFKLRIYANDVSGSATGANSSLVGTTAAAQLVLLVSEIVVYDANGNVQNNADHVAQDGDGVIVYDLGNGWTFEIVSVDGLGDPQAFNAVEIEAIESTNGTVGADGTTTSFKLGEFSFGQSTDLDPVTFSLPVTGTDGDGDSVSSAIDVTVYPDTKSIEGTEAVDLLTGDGGENYLFGYGGNDTLLGGDSDDILLGGLGDDTLTGGGGANIFRWQAGETGHDVVTDFELGVDSLDLSDLLVGEEVNFLEQYLSFSFSVTATTIEARAEAGGSVVQTIELQGVDLAVNYGSSDAGTIIAGMLGDGSLVVDTV